MPASLLPIIATARSGALSHAWRLFREAGLETSSDPAALSLRGRLLKDEALAASGAAQRDFYGQAAAAYRAAARVAGDTYPMVNAATLALLAGDTEASRTGAAAVLRRLDELGDGADTAYYGPATRAEALLLADDIAAAQLALAQAMAAAPLAWEDHASTLRQFGLILAAQGRDAAWLEPYRPPRVLHFAGHTAVASDDTTLAREIAEIVARERIGFAYGALAAGADLIIAEALLAEGCELRLVLPASPELFREASVARFGGDWAARFDACLAQADHLRWLDNGGPSQLDVRIAAEIAMGVAAIEAARLHTEAVQVVVLGGADREPGASAWMGEAWGRAGRRRQTLIHPRSDHGAEAALAAPPAGATACALLTVELPGQDDELLTEVAAIVAAGPTPLVPPRTFGSLVGLAYTAPRDAALVALAIRALGDEDRPLAIAGHYGAARITVDPFTGVMIATGSGQALTLDLLASIPPNAIHVTEDFAAVLQTGPALLQARTEWIGEAPGGDIANLTPLYALLPR